RPRPARDERVWKDVDERDAADRDDDEAVDERQHPRACAGERDDARAEGQRDDAEEEERHAPANERLKMKAAPRRAAIVGTSAAAGREIGGDDAPYSPYEPAGNAVAHGLRFARALRRRAPRAGRARDPRE